MKNLSKANIIKKLAKLKISDFIFAILIKCSISTIFYIIKAKAICIKYRKALI